MINFIVCDDKKYFIDEVINIIDSVMINNNQLYNKFEFNEYNDEFIKIIYSNLEYKIYILDIEVNQNSGIDIARKIRNIDINSMIIFITSYYEKYTKDILKSKFMFLDFIDKKDDYKKELSQTLEYAISNIQKKNIIRFKSQGILYTLSANDILYIKRDKDRKCTIKTSTNEYVVSNTLVELYELLDDRFEQCSKSCIIKKDRINEKNYGQGYFITDTGEKINMLSRKYVCE